MIIIGVIILVILYFFIGGLVVEIIQKFGILVGCSSGEDELLFVLFWPAVTILLILLKFSEFGMFIAKKIFKSIDK